MPWPIARTLCGRPKNPSAIEHCLKEINMLEMDGVVEMVVLKQNLGQSEKLLQKCGPPHHKKTVTNGDLWPYGHWAALIEEGDRIKELWVFRERLKKILRKSDNLIKLVRI